MTASVDLHVHTNASDGVLSPAEVVSAARGLGLRTIAITDHDTVSGVQEAIDAAADAGPEIVPGVELSILGPDGSDAHLLGYFVDHRSPALRRILAELKAEREARAQRMIELLRAAGHPIEFAHVARHAGDGAVGRVHVARALVDAGSVDSVEQAFAELIGREGPFYVRKSTLSLSAALDAIHDCGGVAVLAHPGVSGDAALPALVDAGLDGIEAFHAEHTPEQRHHYAEIARRSGLVATGGSDFHGPGMRSAGLGAGWCPDGAVEALRERARIPNP